MSVAARVGTFMRMVGVTNTSTLPNTSLPNARKIGPRRDSAST
jgi:hypothetical protein